MEKKLPFSPISYHGGLEYAFFGQLIPGAQLNLHIGEAGVGFIAELSKSPSALIDVKMMAKYGGFAVCAGDVTFLDLPDNDATKK